MSVDFVTYQLNEIIEIIGGGTPKRDNPDFWNGDIPWLSVVDFNNDERYVTSTTEKITLQGLARSSTKLLDTGDIIISARGTVGCLAQLSKPMTFNQSCYGLRGKNNLIINDYLYYLLKIKVNELKQKTHGAVFDTITRETFSHINVNIPKSVSKQKKIAKFLSDLDDKIHINNQTNQTLESIAQAIFKSWFIDFEPVRAKIAAKQTGQDPERAAMCAIGGKSEAELEQMAKDDFAELQATAALFPDELVESELGEVPRGWGIGKLKEIIDFNPTRTLKKDSLAPYLDMKNVPTRGHLVDEVILRNMTSGTKFINGDTLLARITPCLENGKTAYVDFLLDNEVGWGSTEFIVLRPKEHLPTALGYFIARQENFRNLAIQSMTGTSGRQRANADTLANQSWLIYPADLMIIFDKYAGKYLTHMKNNGLQNGILKNIRDALLPKLLSGEVDVLLLQQEGA
ncbi:hypothetical protein F938_01822 [Acinetobacter bereziniae LMG 1003 = CIP 70.12]|uniref:Type I restriction modification DNA specificity domain-containing protein n=2 Tax=Acinetobacter TaxID=469 RepID=N9EXW0_ACIBZ|nr:restriction endonuclease subunit S [Acinetobacter proteolyticus]ENV97493.1 hypothetical protein F938_01822 [Acinetobacter bereziniae LMG 1003 = CIP 70.12]VXA55990.1 conserved hypothetical protein [Acinetobacter proteolyticus]